MLRDHNADLIAELPDRRDAREDTEPLRVLVVTQYFWPENFLINDVVEGLEDIGCEVTVLTGQPNYPEGRIYNGYSATHFGESASPGRYDIFRVPLIPRGKGSWQRIANYLSFVVTAAISGTVVLRRRRFDVVLVYAVSPILQALPAILLARFKRAALVVWVQDLWPDTLKSTGHVANEWILSGVGRLTRYIYRKCDLILAQSVGFEAKIRELSGRPVPVKVHHNPGQRYNFEAANVDNIPRLPDGFKIVFAGNLGTAQALETIVEAARLLVSTKCQFVIVGSGSRSDWLAKRIAHLGLGNVHLLGSFPGKAMPGIFDQASALLVTLARSGNLALTIPSKIPSYLAAGKPIIGSLDGEAAETISTSGAGIAVPAEDAAALADAIRKIMNLPESARREMGRSGQKYYEEFFEPIRLSQKLKSDLEEAVRERRAKTAAQNSTSGESR